MLDNELVMILFLSQEGYHDGLVFMEFNKNKKKSSRRFEMSLKYNEIFIVAHWP